MSLCFTLCTVFPDLAALQFVALKLFLAFHARLRVPDASSAISIGGERGGMTQPSPRTSTHLPLKVHDELGSIASSRRLWQGIKEPQRQQRLRHARGSEWDTRSRCRAR